MNNLLKVIKKYDDRVTKGIKWLDKNKKGWLKKIDITRLDLKDAGVCILGQAFGDYWNKVREDGDDDGNKKKISYQVSIALGFALPNEEQVDRSTGYDLLTRVWFARLYQLKFGCKK